MMQSGFTLIEVLIYIAILLITTVALLTLLFSLDDLFLNYRANQLLHTNATTVLQRMTYDIRHAESVIGSTFASNPGTLSLQRGATTTSYVIAGDDLMVSVNGASQGLLTGQAISVPSVLYYHYDNGRTELVRVRLVLEVRLNDFIKRKVFRTAAIMNGTYDE